MKALITGFDPFGGETINPAYEAVKAMSDTIGECEIIKMEIPTVFGKSIDILKQTIDTEQPDIVMCIGQAGGRFGITPEYVAINLDEARIEDNEGNQPSDCPINEEGPNAYFTSLPVKAIVKELTENEIPSNVSYTAGTFVCNHIFYGLMDMIAADYPSIRGGFIHVPYLPVQTLDKKNQPFMPQEMITRALELAVKATVLNESDIQLSGGTEC